MKKENGSFDCEAFQRSIKKSKSKYIKYVKSRPISDIKQMLTTSTKMFGDRTAFMQKFNKNAPYEKITYNQTFSDVNCLGQALLDLDLSKKKVGILGANCYQWAISYLATVCGVGMVVPLDKELGSEGILEICQIAEVDCVIFTEKYKDVFTETDKYILINMDAKEDEGKILSWWKLISKGRDLIHNGAHDFENREIDNEKPVSLIFTSGTTGIAKGVLLSHKNIVADLMMSCTVVKMEVGDIFFSVLPLNHTYECTGGLLMPLYQGCTIAYCQGLKYFSRNMKEVKPTTMLAVPAIIENLQKTIMRNVNKKLMADSFRKGLLINKGAQKVGLELSQFLFKEIKESLGGQLKIIISGGAAINPETLKFMRGLGIIACQGYGLTECSPMTCLNPDKFMKDESAGMLLPNMECKIVDQAEDGTGEICFRGENIMCGYYNDPEATREVIDEEGWYHTGDLGTIDKNNFVFVTGRKKNVIIAHNGKNVFPEEIEYHINQIPYVEECMVWGDEESRDMAIVATIRINEDEVKEELGKDYTAEDVNELIWFNINQINQLLPNFKMVKRVVIKETPFIKTTSSKIKRFEKENRF
ncbi:MAG: AMP-binding protein [Clostridia bacterium]|nr:AMP-binding protein [Clostridia bacterium]